MEKFITADFLLENKYSRELFHGYAENLPVVDFHCHLDPREIAEDRTWANISRIWLGSDHYKWRAMRANGVDERYITGDAPDYEKFVKFAETMPKMPGNPMYHWCHLEMARYFGIDDLLLCAETAPEVWERSASALKNMSARKCMADSKVEAVCTTDDPVSDLGWHEKIAADSSFSVKVLPTFRPDKAFAIEDHSSYIPYLDSLERASGVEIRSYYDLLDALKRRHDYFHARGCRVSDYGVETLWYRKALHYEVEDTFKRAISSSEMIAPDEIVAFKSALLLECAAMDYESGWVRQLHVGPMRNNNSAMFKALGPDSGFDCIGPSNFARSLSLHLDCLNSDGKLGKTVIYNANPADNEMLASLVGNFQSSDCPGKIQMGCAWWFMDSMEGIGRQLEALSSISLLGNFVGMLTDSRSFLSYARHEYFRRILCNFLGEKIRRGILPKDTALAGECVKNVCYSNPKAYFGF